MCNNVTINMSCVSNMIPELELGSMYVCIVYQMTELKNAHSNTEHFTLLFAKP